MRQKKNGCETSVGSISSHPSTVQDASEHNRHVMRTVWLVSQPIGNGIQLTNTDASMRKAEL